MAIDVEVNGKSLSIEADPNTPLLWVIREELGLTGTKFGCGIGACGACSIHVDGEITRSCSIPVASVAGKRITTIEGIAAPNGTLHPVQQAWIDAQVPQCGYCQSGQIMAAVALIRKTGLPSPAHIDQAMTNICRCGTYPRIRKAILAATGQAAGGEAGRLRQSRRVPNMDSHCRGRHHHDLLAPRRYWPRITDRTRSDGGR